MAKERSDRYQIKKVNFSENAHVPPGKMFMSQSATGAEIEGGGLKNSPPHSQSIKVRIGARSVRAKYF